MYSVGDRKSFNSVTNWLEVLKEIGNSQMHICLVGNKSDLTTGREVSTDEGKALAAQHNLKFIETSALAGTNVREAGPLLIS